MSRQVSGRFLAHFRKLFLKRRYSNLSYFHNVGEEPLRPLTLGQLLEQISVDYGKRPAVISRHQGKTITFEEVLYKADRLAAGFYKLGFSNGDKVGILSPNLLEWYVVSMACARAGFLLIPLNPAYQSKELEYCINKVGIKGLVIAKEFKYQNFYELVNAICKELPKSKPGQIKSANLPTLKTVVVLADDKMKGCYRYSDVMNMASEENIEMIRKMQGKIKVDDPCNVQLTSGTTGKSKVAVISHFSMVNNGYFIGKRTELNTKYHIACLQNPFFHAYGLVIGISAALNYASTLVLPAPGFDPEKSLDAMKEEKCTIIYGTPTMFIDLVKHQKERQEQIVAEIALTGGASCSPQLFQDMLSVLKVRKVKSVYGLSESTASIFQSLPQDSEYEATSTVGYLQEHLEAKVVDRDNNIVPKGVPGELCVRGYSTMLEYLDDPEKTLETVDKSKWLHTGDEFIIDETGYGKIVGRIKELIIRGGENIYPKEIEDLLQTHPEILEVQVIGLPHERLGEEVCACVKLQADSKLTVADLKQFCRGEIAHFKIPSVLKIVDSFPTTASGKIQKFKLREEVISSL